jgi:hypothetical protein
MPVRQFSRNLQTRGALVAAFLSEKREMTIKKSLFRHGPFDIEFFHCVFANPCTM